MLSVLGCSAFFLLLVRSRESALRWRRQWSVGGAVAGGLGVWTTHFVAMLAHRPTVPIRFGIGLTLASIIEVVALFWLAVIAVRPGLGLRQVMRAGMLMGCGVAAMHFTGMAAIVGTRVIHYAPGPIVVAFLLATALFIAAFTAFARLDGWARVAMPAMLAVIGVCGLHFSAMAATTMQGPGHDAMPMTLDGGIGRPMLITAVIVAGFVLLSLAAAGALIDRYLSDLRGLADAALEGLAIAQEGRIVEANARFAAMVGVMPTAIVGTLAENWLHPADGESVTALRDHPVEAGPANARDGEHILELATHRIEYRGRDGVVLAVRDLTERKQAERRIEHLAGHDPLTDLPNRALFDDRLAKAMALARRGGQAVALLAVDLDRFKAVNDVFGHAAGDAVLKRVAALLCAETRAEDTVARIGGDEFLVLQVGVAQPTGARALVARILDAFAREMDPLRDPTSVGASIGVAIFPDDAVEAEALRLGADIALYRAKERGRGMACFFDSAMDAAARARRALEQDLRHAVLRSQFHLLYQPLVHAADARVWGYEALLRWAHPEQGTIMPDLFVPIAEECGAIVGIGEWVLAEACRAAAGWTDGCTIAVNVSPVQFRAPNLIGVVRRVLDETGLAPERLELEITEGVLMRDRDAAIATLRGLKALGVRIVVDDFGTGYSSLGHLQSFPFDKIKIDGSFIAAMERDPAARSIVNAIAGIGRSLSLPVVAEGVETEAQWRIVVAEGCPQAQGFLFGHPAEYVDAPKARHA